LILLVVGILIVGLVCVCLLGGAVCVMGWLTVPPLPGPQPAGGTSAGSTAPDFTLQDLDGRSVTLGELRGQVVLIDFWATWCTPCKHEMPHLQDMYERYRDRGFTVLAVDVGESANQARPFIEGEGYTFPVLLDSQSKVFRQYGVRALPTVFVVDTQGVIREVKVGYASGSERELARIVESLLPR